MDVDIFVNNAFGDVRCFKDDEEEIWFCLSDLCKPLELEAKEVKRQLGDEVCKTHLILDAIGRKQNVLFTNEEGMYTMMIRSHKPQAKAFTKWLCKEVIPSIRKTGNYISNAEGAVKEGFSKLGIEAKDKVIKELTEKLQKEKEKNKGYKMLDAYGNKGINVSEVATLFGFSAPKFNLLLQALGVQHKVGKTWVINAKYDNKGYTTFYSLDVTHSDGTIERVVNTQWSQKGVNFLISHLEKNDIHIRK